MKKILGIITIGLLLAECANPLEKLEAKTGLSAIRIS
jgi:hypothetical protein